MLRLSKHRRYLLSGGGVLVLAMVAWGAWFQWFRISTSELMRRGSAAVQRFDSRTAVRMLDAVLSREPQHVQALLLRGQLAREAGFPDEALRYWRRVPEVPANDASRARLLEGTLLVEEGHARQAESVLLRAVELDPAYLPPREYLLRLYVIQQRATDIRLQLAALWNIRKSSLPELLLYSMADSQIEDPGASLALLERFATIDPDDAPSLLSLAKCRAAQGDDARAIELLQSRLQKDARLPGLSGLLADLLLKRADLASAGAVLRAAPWPDGTDKLFCRSLGLHAAAVHDWDRARIALERATALDPDDLVSTYRLGLVWDSQENRQAADHCLERAKRLEQLDAKLHLVAREKERSPAELAPVAAQIAGLLIDLGHPELALLWAEQSLEWVPGNRAAVGLHETLGPQSRLVPLRLPGSVSREFSALFEKADTPGAPPWDPGQQRLRPGPALPAKSASDPGSPIILRDCHASAGVVFEYFNGATGSKYLLETLGGGVAVLDYDGDDWPDLYFTQGARIPYDPQDQTHQDRLFRNLGNGRFEDVTAAAGLGDNRYSQGCVAGDIDNDGDMDLVVANWGENSLYVNNGDGTFVEAGRTSGLQGDRWHSSLALADFDRDGNLDLYVVTYMLEPLKTCRTSDGRIATCHPGNFAADQDVVYRNRGDGTFEDVSVAAGIRAPDGKGLGVVVADLDNDGWPDIYVANDGTGNFLFRNAGATTTPGLHFAEEGLISGAAVSADGLAQGSMGIAAGDLNGDGLLDLYVTNFYFEGSALYLNQGHLSFTDAVRESQLYGPTHPMVGFGAQAIDFDLDGWLDLFATNGHIDDFRYRGEPWKMSPQLFRNRGSGHFSDVSLESGEFFRGKYLGRSAVRVDWDRDGKPDVVVTHLDRPAALLRNETPVTGNSVVIELHGVESNRDAIGARLKMTVAGAVRICEISGGDGYFASNERRQTIGLGASERLDVLEIAWPSGRVQRFTELPRSERLCIVEGRGL